MKGPSMSNVRKPPGKRHQGFADYEAITDKNLCECPRIARFKAIAEPAFGDVEQCFSVYK
jgi:hypothetical protein